ncbi:MAG: hypothetical protein HY674_09480, partial [Chloroflexi bacterium]|nr:hypothetical protein [Chloroflexota bacterium]
TKPATGEEVRADSRRLLRIKEAITLLRGDLDWIVMKCLEKDRARRYETANGLASDIQRHLNNEAVLARPPSAAYRFQKLVRRNKLAFAAAAAVASVLVLGTAISTWQAVRATQAKREALDAQQKEAQQHRLTDEALALARKRLYAAEMTLAFEALKADNLGRTRKLLARQQPQGKSGANASEPEIDLRGWEWRHLWHRTRGEEEFTLAGHSNSVAGALFLNDGRTIVSAADDDTLRFWDVQRRTNTLTLPLSGGTHSLALSPDGRWLAVAGDPWQLFDTARRQLQFTGTNSDDVGGLVFSPDSQQLALAAGPEIRVLEMASRQILRIIDRSGDRRYDAYYMGLAFSPDGHGLATVRRTRPSGSLISLPGRS